jgi:hypothetical protein
LIDDVDDVHAGPIIVAAFTEAYPGVLGWRWVFILTDATCMCALVVWILFQTSDVVPELNTPLPALEDSKY